MSKWLQVLLLALAAAGSLFITWTTYDSNSNFQKRGKTALVDPPAQYTEETRTKTKVLTGIQSSTTSRWAEMSYTAEGGSKVAFKRELSDDILNKLKRGEKVYVEYLPGEYNSERFKGEEPGVLYPLLAFVAAAAALGFVIMRKKK